MNLAQAVKKAGFKSIEDAQDVVLSVLNGTAVTHWIRIDPSKRNLKEANKLFRDSESYRWAIKRIYLHPSGVDAVFEVVSPDQYKDLHMTVDSLRSPLQRDRRKPQFLGNGSEVSRWEAIYGKLDAPRLEGITQKMVDELTEHS